MRARRLPVIDEYVDGDQAAVFVGGQVLVLAVLATAVLRAVGEQWTELAAVTEEVVLRVGTPSSGGAEDAIADILDELAGRGLVQLSK